MTTGATRIACEEFVRELPDFLDRELTTLRQTELARHLRECAHCLRTYRFERSLVDRIRSRLSRIDLPVGLSERVALSIGVVGVGASGARKARAP